MIRGKKHLRIYSVFATLLVTGSCVQVGKLAHGHPSLRNHVQHRTLLTVTCANTDITIELTIGELPALEVRSRMDYDRDGVITREEVDAFLAGLRDLPKRDLSLTVAGEPLELICLYEPEMDLLGNKRVSAARLVLRFFYFARTPAALKAGDQITLTDRLWSQVPNRGWFEARGCDGVEVTGERETSVLASAPNAERPLEMCARCARVPADFGSRARSNPRSSLEARPAHPPNTWTNDE